MVRLLGRAYLPADDPIEKISILGTDTAQLIDTFNHNLTCSADNLRFQRKASNLHIKPEFLPAINSFITKKGQAFLEDIDFHLSQNECKDGPGIEVNVSVFYHESSDSEFRS